MQRNPRRRKKHTSWEAISHDEAEFVVVDVETTGLSAENGDRICEIGAVKLSGGAVLNTFGSLINPQRPVSYGAYRVHQIPPEQLAVAPPFSSVTENFLDFIGDAILVGYNLPFDLSFISAELKLAGGSVLSNRAIDALPLVRQIIPGLGRYSQETVARVLGIPFPKKHRALEDATVTARIFTLMTTILKAHDCPAVADLSRIDLSRVLSEKRVTVIHGALSTGTDLWLRYLSPAESLITERRVTPREVIQLKGNDKGKAILLAYCHASGAERQFQLDRILDARPVSPLFIVDAGTGSTVG